MRLLRWAYAVSVVGAVAFVGNAVARPGCSLLPVEMPGDTYRSGPGATRAQACAALGRPMPEVRHLPLGLHETGLSVAGPPPVGPDNHRFVSVFYAVENGRNVVELMTSRGDGIPPGNAGDVNDTVNGAPAIVTERTYPAQSPEAQFTMVTYMWPRNGLLHLLRVRLERGIDRAMADQMAASVR